MASWLSAMSDDFGSTTIFMISKSTGGSCNHPWPRNGLSWNQVPKGRAGLVGGPFRRTAVRERHHAVQLFAATAPAGCAGTPQLRAPATSATQEAGRTPHPARGIPFWTSGTSDTCTFSCVVLDDMCPDIHPRLCVCSERAGKIRLGV